MKLKSSNTQRLGAALLALVMMAGIATPAFAVDEDSSVPATTGTSTSTSTPGVEPTLQDPYISAYTPMDANGKELSTIAPGTTFTLAVAIVHPGAAHFGATVANARVRLNPGAFTMADTNASYCKDVGSDSADLRYTVVFPNVTYVGGTPTGNMDISYASTGTNQVNVGLKTLAVTVGQCSDTTVVPDIILQSATYGGSSVAAGSNFTLATRAKNTSTNLTVENVVASITLPEGITLNGGSSSIQIGNVGPGGTLAANFPLTVKSAVDSGSLSVQITYTFYALVQGARPTSPYTVTQTVSIPVQQPDRFSVDGTEIASFVYLGEEGAISISYSNKGRSILYNLTGEIKGENLANPSSLYQGNLAAGTEGSMDFYVQANETGVMTGEVIISYEDAGGEKHTVSTPFSINVEEMPVYNGGFEPEIPAEPEKKSNLPLVIGGIVAVLAAGGGFFYYKKKKKAKDELMEDENEDF